MGHINVEWKASTNRLAAQEQIIKELGADYKGTDHQIDTYFKVPKGRLKLREGNIENSLIFYERTNIAASNVSSVILYQCTPNAALKDILLATQQVLTTVDKHRKIYFIDNVKFHFDEVHGLGTFLEVEAIDVDGRFSKTKLGEQCAHYAQLLGVQQSEYQSLSYSDLLMQ